MKQWQRQSPTTQIADWQSRLNILTFCFLALAGLMTWRLFQKSVIEHPTYAAKAESQYEVSKELPSRRGAILAQDAERGVVVPMAATEELFDISVVPRNVKDKHAAAAALAKVFLLDEQAVFEQINNDRLYIPPIVRGVSKVQKEAIVEQGFSGLLIERRHQRVYPQGSIGAHILGFVNRDGIGNYGVEGYYEDDLHGIAGSVVGEKDTLGRLISTVSKVAPEDGVDLELTIDHNVQFAAEERLARSIEATGAKSGQIVVMDPTNGELIALAATPTFDPNRFNEYAEHPEVFLNPTISSVYEPGSIMKPIIMAAAIDRGKIEPDTEEVFGESVVVQGYEIRTALDKAFGRETMTQVLENSDNVGMVWVADKMSSEEMYEHFLKFGFGDATDIDLVGETQGALLPVGSWRAIHKATMSFGQGISVTPMQMVRAWAAMINGGTLVTPHVTKKVVGERGVAVEAEWSMEEGVIRPETSEKLRRMLESVVTNGPYGRTRIAGYAIGGKTGTAQIAAPEGGYLESEYTHSLMGFFPADAPRFLILVKVDRPETAEFAESTAGPLFNDLVKYMINYYDIAPSKEKTE